MDQVYSLQSVFAGRMFRIPDYQRGYAWEKTQCQELLDDIESFAGSGDHYVGTLNMYPRQEKCRDIGSTTYEVFDVVDGQQRLTTLVILLDAITREMSQFDFFKESVNDLRKAYIVTRGSDGQVLPKLTLNRDCHPFFLHNILRQGSADIAGSRVRSHELLLQAQEYFDSQLARQRERLEGAYPDWLGSLVDKVTQRLKFLIYPVSSDTEAGVIFETTNTRGKKVTELDIVKNHFLYLASIFRVNIAQQVNETWTHIFESLMQAGLVKPDDEEQLLRVHWLMAYDYRPGNWKKSKTIKRHFSAQRYKDKPKELIVTELDEYLASLRNVATAFCETNVPERSNTFQVFKSSSLYDEVREASIKLARLGILAPFTPLLVAFRLKYHDNAQLYLRAVTLCERFAFRVYRCASRRTGTGESTLYRLSHELFHGHSPDGVLNQVQGTLLEYCSDSTMLNRFREGADCYHWSGLKYMLYEYEEYLARQAGQPIAKCFTWSHVVSRDETIEHVLPQTPEADSCWTEWFTPEERKLYTHDLGNLCLTWDNSWLSNRPFSEKKAGKPGQSDGPGYAKSNIRVEKQIANHDKWTPETVNARRKEILQWAMERWHVDPVDWPPQPPDGDDDARLQLIADKNGVGDEFRVVLRAAEGYSQYLYARRQKNWGGVCFAPLANKRKALLWVCPDHVWIGFPAFEEYLRIPAEEVKSILGPEERRPMGRAQAEEMVSGLKQLFDKIAQMQSSKTDLENHA